MWRSTLRSPSPGPGRSAPRRGGNIWNPGQRVRPIFPRLGPAPPGGVGAHCSVSGIPRLRPRQGQGPAHKRIPGCHVQSARSQRTSRRFRLQQRRLRIATSLSIHPGRAALLAFPSIKRICAIVSRSVKDRRRLHSPHEQMRNRGTGFAQRGQLDGVILWMSPVVKCITAVRRRRLSGPPTAVIVECSRSAIH